MSMLSTPAAWWTGIFICLAGFLVLGGLFYSQRAETHGALAIGLPANVARHGVAFGYAVNHRDEAKAAAEAIEYCRSFKQAEHAAAEKCEVVRAFVDECLAVAMDREPGTRGFGWAVRPTKQAAEKEAIAMCIASATPTREKHCVVVSWGCDGKLW